MTEKLIYRVQTLISFGLSKKEICDTLDGVPTELVFLAWHAAKLL